MHGFLASPLKLFVRLATGGEGMYSTLEGHPGDAAGPVPTRQSLGPHRPHLEDAGRGNRNDGVVKQELGHILWAPFLTAVPLARMHGLDADRS